MTRAPSSASRSARSAHNARAAALRRHAGRRASWSQSALLSGALAGLAGASEVAGLKGYLTARPVAGLRLHRHRRRDARRAQPARRRAGGDLRRRHVRRRRHDEPRRSASRTTSPTSSSPSRSSASSSATSSRASGCGCRDRLALSRLHRLSPLAGRGFRPSAETSGAKRSGGEGAVPERAPFPPQRLLRRRPLTLACFAGLLPSAALSPQTGRGEPAPLT